MPLLLRSSVTDTWAELEEAAAERYWDAIALAMEERLTGAMYMLGYAFEMLVKCAYYRFIGLGPTDNVAPVLRGMKDKARLHGFSWRGNLHNSESVISLLVLERRVSGHPMDTGVSATAMGYAVSLARFEWSETLRYKRVAASELEMTNVLESVDWLQTNYAALWS